MSDGFAPAAFGRVASPDDARAEAAARAAGFAAGYAEGARVAAAELERQRAALEREAAAATAQAEERLQRRLDALDRVTRALEARVEPVVSEAQRALGEAAVDLAEAILGVELSDTDASARSIVARVLDAVEVSDVVTLVRVNPMDAPAVAEELGERRGYQVVADETLAPGDVVAELSHGFVDGRVASALARARAALGA